MLIRFDAVSLAFGSRPLLDHVRLQIDDDERLCLVGRNGEGKSSLLRMLLGRIDPDAGEIWRRPGARIAELPQEPGGLTGNVGEIVASGLADDDTLESWQSTQRVTETLSRLQLDPDAVFESLSGGWQRRALLARALVGEPQLLLLDEPTNHLDIEAIEWLEAQLLARHGALLFVSHDRTFANRVATRVIELDRGRLTSFDGNYDFYAQAKAQLLEEEARREALFDKKLAQEEVWIRKGVEARRTRNEGRVRSLYALREDRRERRERTGRIDLPQQGAADSGQLVFEAEDVGFSFGDRPIVRDFSTRILRGERIGIVGPNGAGKSTLIRLLLGELEPQHGTIRRGARLEVAYYDQQRAQLELTKSVIENVAGRNDQVIIGGQPRHVVGYLRDFLFRPEQLRTPASALSGGERNRLLLARLFARPANLLVLDEPTNDLDIDTLELLEEFVAEYSGTLLMVSHDRAFLDHVVTSLLVFEGEGRVRDFVGGWSDLQRYRSRRATELADQAASRPAAATRDTTSATARPARAGRLSYKEQRELDALPALLEALESEKQTLETDSSDPAFYGRPQEEIAKVFARLTAVSAEIDTAYERWNALEARKA